MCVLPKQGTGQFVTKCNMRRITFTRLVCEKSLTMMNRLLPLITGFVCLFQVAMAQLGDARLALKLLGRSHDVPVNEDKKLNGDDLAEWPVIQGRYYGVVSLEHFPNKRERRALQLEGVDVLEFLPERFYLISLTSIDAATALQSFGVTHVGPFKDAYKWVADPRNVPLRAMVGHGRLSLILSPFKGVALSSLATALHSLEECTVEDVNEDFGFVNVTIDEGRLVELERIKEVRTIEWVYPEGKAENYTSRALARTQFLSYDNSNDIAYNGNGVSVAIQDNGSIGPHIDYHGRLQAQFTADNEGNHADHVTGTVGGAGNLNPRHQGQAEGADLYVYKAYPEYNALSNLDSHYYAYDIHLTSTSYSDGCNAGYTSRTQLVDEQSVDYEKLIHVYSAGNAGGSNCGYGAGSGWGNITGGHKMGKNTMVVANLTNTETLASSSSRGPATDGRIKPDIAAQGTAVTSTIEGNQYDTYTGTSMACPNVAGSLTLLYEAFGDHHGEHPDGGLMKAIVLNTAEDLGNTGPDFKFGWGRINARRAYSTIEQGTFIVDSIASGAGANSHEITVPAGANRLRVMVYWTDPAATISASTALVNDLDLTGFSPNNDTLLPYVLNHLPNAITLDEPAVFGEDHLNNMEQIEVVDPTPGNYTFEVSPYLVPQGPQEYFVVYYIEEAPLVLTYPVGGESFEPDTSEIIRWDSELSGDITVEYSDDAGSSWNTVTTGVDAAQEYYQWTLPLIEGGDVQVRLVHDSVTVASDNFSIMSVPTNVSINWACPDGIGLSWDPQGSALSFDIYKLGEKYMDSIGTSVTNDFTDTTSNPYSNMLWYAVSANGPDGAKSFRTVAVKKTPGLQNCFLAKDIGALHIFPDISHAFACHGEEVEVSFSVENGGVTPSTAFLATLYGPNGALVNDSFSTSIGPLESDTFSFLTNVVLDSGINEYYLLLEMEGDLNPYNDTARRAYKVLSTPGKVPVWEEHFDQMAFECDAQIYCGAFSCPLPEGWINAENGVFDDIDWRVHGGPTLTAATGPSADNTTQSEAGKYIYLEASGGCIHQEAILISPCIDLSEATEPMLTFYYNMRGFDMGELHVDVFDGTHWQLDLAEFTGHQGTLWRFVEVDLSDFNGKVINVRFRGITDQGDRGDMALDDISIVHPPVANFEYLTQSNGQTVLFNDFSLYADDMTFDLGDGTVLLDSVPFSHDYAQQISYTVKQVVSNSFGMDSLSVSIVNLGLRNGEEQRVMVFPNPTGDKLTIQGLAGGQIHEAKLWSLDGRLVKSASLDHSDLMVIDVKSLSSGSYILMLKGSETSQHHIMVVH